MTMSSDKKNTITDDILNKLKNNPIVATLIIVSLVITGIAGLGDSVIKLIDLICPPTYESQFNKTVKLIGSNDPQKKIEGITLLQELTKTYPLKRQESVNYLQSYVMKNFPQDKDIDKKDLPVLEQAIRTLTTLPRFDENNHRLNIELNQIRIEHLNLENTNFEGVSLWGSQFIDVIVSRSSFKNADLGGTQFKDSSLEYADLEGAKITGSFMDQENGHARPTRFIKTRLYGSTLEKAMIDNCELIGINDFQVDMLKKCTVR